MWNRQVAVAGIAMLLVVALGLGCAASGGSGIGIGLAQGTPTATRTRIPRDSIDFNATVLAATIQAGGGYIVTSTPPPVFPTATPTPFDQASFLATINAQFAQATETALARATPTFTPSPTPPPTLTPTPTAAPPRFLPPAGGYGPGKP